MMSTAKPSQHALSLAALRARIEGRISSNGIVARTVEENIAQYSRHKAVPVTSSGRARIQLKPIMVHRRPTPKGDYPTIPKPSFNLFDLLSDDLIALIIIEFGVERDMLGAPIPHPSTIPELPAPKPKTKRPLSLGTSDDDDSDDDDAPLPVVHTNSMDVPLNDTKDYIGFGSMWRTALARTCSRLKVIVATTPASPWAVPMNGDLAKDRVQWASSRPFFLSPAFVLLLVRDFVSVTMPDSRAGEVVEWCAKVELGLIISTLSLAKWHAIPHERINVLARVYMVTSSFPRTQGRDLRLYENMYMFRNTPSGGAVLLTLVEEICTVCFQLKVPLSVTRFVLSNIKASVEKDGKDPLCRRLGTFAPTRTHVTWIKGVVEEIDRLLEEARSMMEA